MIMSNLGERIKLPNTTRYVINSAMPLGKCRICLFIVYVSVAQSLTLGISFNLRNNYLFFNYIAEWYKVFCVFIGINNFTNLILCAWLQYEQNTETIFMWFFTDISYQLIVDAGLKSTERRTLYTPQSTNVTLVKNEATCATETILFKPKVCQIFSKQDCIGRFIGRWVNIFPVESHKSTCRRAWLNLII